MRTAEEMWEYLFENSIEVEGPLPNSKCRIWVGTLWASGYGRVTFQNREWQVHRLMYFLCYGPIPPRMEIQHTCDWRDCLAIDHLELGTHAENMRDMAIRERGGQTYLSNDQVIELRTLHANGHSQASLMRRFKTGRQNVSLIVRGGSRQHIGGPLAESKRPPPTSQFTGVHFNKEHGKWMVGLSYNGKCSYLGQYHDEISAALAYNAEVVRLGLNKPLNQIPLEDADA